MMYADNFFCRQDVGSLRLLTERLRDQRQRLPSLRLREEAHHCRGFRIPSAGGLRCHRLTRCSCTIRWHYSRCLTVPTTTTILLNIIVGRRVICWDHLDRATTWVVDLSIVRVVRSVDFTEVLIALVVTRRHRTWHRMCLWLGLRPTMLTHRRNKTCILPFCPARVRRAHSNILVKAMGTLALAQDRVMERLNERSGQYYLNITLSCLLSIRVDLCMLCFFASCFAIELCSFASPEK